MSYNVIGNDEELRKPLSDEAIKELLKQYKAGDITARTQIIEHNIRLVINRVNCVNHKYIMLNLDLEEMFEAGIDGLIKSIDTFDESRSTCFSTYATNGRFCFM